MPSADELARTGETPPENWCFPAQMITVPDADGSNELADGCGDATLRLHMGKESEGNFVQEPEEKFAREGEMLPAYWRR